MFTICLTNYSKKGRLSLKEEVFIAICQSRNIKNQSI